MRIADFDRAPDSDAETTARLWADVPQWVGVVVDERPYGSVDALVDRARRASARWGAAELDAALGRHARIGEAPRGDSAEAAASRREQSAVTRAGSGVAARLADANARYEARFGRVFLIRAAGRSPKEILGELERRLRNDDETEVREACSQLAEIAILRIRSAFENETSANETKES
ncbi:2-oxo-4-hydroxy-4-carboxy-5-ureidoimidazoline decarboxylase [Microbacterium karelineae]|uniref:2-oxo-4-hydroxy-4-carboxy-5-ureidoimidazoline decarboxylase n=1 Tax=Microbacterium karelineae TaxID=2654283 RepID=UPI0012EAC866|nr:2-oxo-4-hydroxy-4-carboxy-5-ureidoimidazoline decarboxylase [Microbacterium karelineae]